MAGLSAPSFREKPNAGPVPAFGFEGLVIAGPWQGYARHGWQGDWRVSNDQSLQAQLKDAVARGDKDAVAALMRQGGITGLMQTLRAVQAAASEQSTLASAKSAFQRAEVQVPAAVKNALQQGNLIEAIKRLREANPGLSLKAAKEHVDALGARLPVKQAQRAASTFASARERTPTVVMGDKPGGLRWLFVLIAFAGLALWWSTT